MTRVTRWLCVLVLSVGIGVGAVPETARASGIPTVDIAQIIQGLTSYITELSGYAEALLQTGIEEAQLAQMIQDYAQTLVEYESYLKQVRGLKDAISGEDWEQVMKVVVESPYGEEILGQIPTLDPKSVDFINEVRERVGKYGLVPQDTQDVVDRYAAMGVELNDLAHIQAHNDRLNQHFSKQTEQMSMVSRNEAAIQEREEKLKKYDSSLRGLGQESELATAQLGVVQQNLAGHQREATIRALNQMMLTYESPSAALANRRAAMVEQEIQRLEKVRANSTNHTLGSDSWGGGGW